MGTVSVSTRTKTTSKGVELTDYIHDVTLLDDSGRTRVHQLIEGHRLDRFLDEKLEPVLALFGYAGSVKSLIPIDSMTLTKISSRGRLVLTPFAWFGLLVIPVMPWITYSVLQS
jgi:hypothetical protein